MPVIIGTPGNDTLSGSTGNDTITALGGRDLVFGKDGDDIISGGSEQDSILGQAGNDVLSGDDGNDRIDGGAGNDTLFGGRGNDRLFGGDGADNLSGGDGNDKLLGGDGADTLAGGAGNDRMLGGRGEDSLELGPGNDVAMGGTSSDIFTFIDGRNHRIIGGEDLDGTDVDVLDLSGVNANVIQTGPESGRIEFLDDDGKIVGRGRYSEIEQVIICFTPGALIATRTGEVFVEKLRVGDKIITRDNGIQTLRWVGRRELSENDLRAHPQFQPILIRRGALGNGLPERDLVVSPQHRMLLTSNLAELMFDEREVLVAAKHLTGLDGVDRVASVKTTYLHLMFDRHEVVVANGAWSESFQPGDWSLNGIGAEQRGEVLALFPELETAAGLESYGAARLSLKHYEAALLVDRLR